ncbi:MAG TPA: APC family permease [Anaerolineaceae bacterium]
MSQQSGTHGKEVDLFVRKATGLVRSWSMVDALIYATFSINLVTLGLYIFSQMYFLEGGLLPTLLVSSFFVLFEVVVYASLTAIMPRSGGDYVWQSRILGGGIGFILAVTGWWFILWLWVPLYSDMLRHIVLTPLLGILGAKDAALWFGGTALGLFVTTLIMLAFVTFYIAIGMKWYARIQKVCFWGGLVGLLLVFVLLLFGSPEGFKNGFEQNAQALFGAPPDVYAATLKAGEDAGAVNTLMGGGLNAIFLAIPFIVFFNLWPNWGSTLYGEIRGASDFKRNFWGMALALIGTTVLGIIFFLLINKTVGWEFYTKANGAWWNFTWGYTEAAPPLPVWPYPALLAVFLSSSRLVQFVVVLLMSLWWFGWSGTVFLSSTRVIFAASFDRLLPDKVAEVEPATRTPIYALLLMVVPSLVVSALFSWDLFGFRSLTLDSTLVIAVTYLGTTVAAILLPYLKKDLYNASPVAKYKVFGVPLITVAGVIFGGFLIFLLYQWLIDPNELYGIGLKNPASIVFMFVNYGLAALIYFGMRAYRKRKGVDIDKVYQEIPVE